MSIDASMTPFILVWSKVVVGVSLFSHPDNILENKQFITIMSFIDYISPPFESK